MTITNNIRRTFRRHRGFHQSKSTVAAVRAAEGGTRPPVDFICYDDLVRLAPNTALAIAAGLPNIQPTRPRPCTGLTEEELLCGYCPTTR